MEQRPFIPLELGDGALAVPSPAELHTEMTICFEGQTVFSDWVTMALETLQSQILHRLGKYI